MDNDNLKFVGYLSEIYKNLDTPKNARKYARLTAVELFKTEFPVSVQKKMTLTRREVHIGETEGKIPCIREYLTRTGLDSLIEAKRNVEKYFADNGLTFFQK